MELTSLGFEASYSVERLEGRPAGSAREFRRPRRVSGAGELVLETGSESLWFEVIPVDGEPWVGAFECGPGGATRLFATPSPTVLCVVAKGQGFWIPVLAPAGYEVIRSIPIQEAFVVPGEPKLVFVDHTRLAAYGPSGFLWVTDDLSWDGLKITEVTTGMIWGMAWDSLANERTHSLSIRRTGRARAGRARRSTGQVLREGHSPRGGLPSCPVLWPYCGAISRD